MTTAGDSSRARAAHAYVASRGVAQLGGAVSEAILPVIVVVTLGGSPGEVGGVLAVTLVVSLVSRIIFAPFVDRRDRQIVLQAWAQIIAAGAACVVPLLWAADRLNYQSLVCAIVLIVITQSVVQTCGHATVNTLVRPASRVAVIGRLNSLASASDIVGQSGGPALTKLIPAPLIMVVDATANVLSAGLLFSLRRWDDPSRESQAESTAREQDDAGRPTYRVVVREALAFRPVWVLWASAVANGTLAPVVLIYITRDLGVPVPVVGVVFATGALGGIVGGVVVGRLLEALTLRAVLLGATAVGLISVLGVLAASTWPTLVYPLLVTYEFASAFSGTVIVASVFGMLQVRNNSDTVARSLTVASTGLELAGLLGVGIGAAIAEFTTTRTVVLSACGLYAGLLVLGAWLLKDRSATR